MAKLESTINHNYTVKGNEGWRIEKFGEWMRMKNECSILFLMWKYIWVKKLRVSQEVCSKMKKPW